MADELSGADLANLRLFVDAVRLGSLSAAAREHRITQPSASEAIRRLERRLGVELLVRSPRGSRPTGDGARLAAAAGRVLAELAAFSAEARAVRAAGRRQLRIAASYTNAEYLLPSGLARFRAERPDVTVSLRVANSSGVIALVSDRSVDIGFVEDPAPHPGLSTARIAADELTVLVAPGHPWAGRAAPLPAALLAATPLLLREPESGTRATLSGAVRHAGLDLTDPLGVMTSTEALKAAVRAGLGATVLSRLAAQDELSAGTLREVPVDGLDLRRELRAVWLPAQRADLVSGLVPIVLATVTRPAPTDADPEGTR